MATTLLQAASASLITLSGKLGPDTGREAKQLEKLIAPMYVISSLKGPHPDTNLQKSWLRKEISLVIKAQLFGE